MCVTNFRLSVSLYLYIYEFIIDTMFAAHVVC